MYKNQIILSLFGLLALSLLFFLGKRSITKKANATSASEMPANTTADIKAADFETLYANAEKLLSEKEKQKNTDLLAIASKSPTAVNYKNIAENWERLKEINIAAYYYKKAALLENTIKSINFAGNLFLALVQNTPDPEIKKWQAVEAIGCFEKSLELQPDNLVTKTALATCYTDGTGETMKGVGLLREVTAVDSLQPQANLLLGKLSVQSGQFDKAIKRMEIVLKSEPKNTEALYFLAEAYKGSGNKAKAIELFEKCKSLVSSPEFAKEIDNYIQSFR